MVDQALAESGLDVSEVETMDELEEQLGMSVDDMMIASVGTDLDSFVQSSFNAEMLKGLTDSLNLEGGYSFDGETLTLENGEEMTVTFQDEDTILLEGDDGGSGVLPLTFTRDR